jgi:hypothetical protein
MRGVVIQIYVYVYIYVPRHNDTSSWKQIFAGWNNRELAAPAPKLARKATRDEDDDFLKVETTTTTPNIEMNSA